MSQGFSGDLEPEAGSSVKGAVRDGLNARSTPLEGGISPPLVPTHAFSVEFGRAGMQHAAGDKSVQGWTGSVRETRPGSAVSRGGSHIPDSRLDLRHGENSMADTPCTLVPVV